MNKAGIVLFVSVLFLFSGSLFPQGDGDNFYMRGAFYLDWFGSTYEGSDFFHQASTRLNLELFNRRGDGWTLRLDARDRLRLSEPGRNQVLLYGVRLSYEKQTSPWFASLGQMNLYDTAGIGQLLGGAIGYKPFPDLLVGGYAGLESSVYVSRVNTDYQKFGLFARYLGSLGKNFSISYNHVRFSGRTERQFLHAGGFFPVRRVLYLYGNLEYELGSPIRSEDRLSRIFLNARVDITDAVDLTGHYSSGRGLDFHQYVLEASQDPSLNDRELERYYYSSQYGARLSYKPARGIRLYMSRQESEQKDENIRNHTWRFGGAYQNIMHSGWTVYGSYASNRGEISESDSYYLSVSKDFGRVSWNVSFSNTFNGLRYDNSGQEPRIIHLDDYKSLSTYFFIPIDRALAFSLEYEYFLQTDANQHLFFVRMIFRK
jgi:hypothetical protein